jgi:uncharacterized protein YlzI (FlbEa/FlbD family)
MKIRLHKPGGLFSSAKEIIIDSGKIENIQGDVDGSTVTMTNGDSYDVRETPEAIEKLYTVKPPGKIQPPEPEPEPEDKV